MDTNVNITFAIITITLFTSVISLQNNFILEEEQDVIKHCLTHTIFDRKEDVWLIQNATVFNHNIENLNQAIMLFNLNNFPKQISGNTYPVIITFGLDDFQKLMDKSIEGLKILVIIQDGKIETIFEMAKRNKIYDLTVALFDNNQLDFYTWFYFAPNNFCGQYLNLTLIGKCNGKSIDFTNLFPVKFMYTPTNCVLNVGWWTAKPFVIDPFVDEAPGVFVSIFRDVSWASGMVLKYEEKDLIAEWEFLNEGYYNRLSKRLEEEEFDVLLGQVYLNYSNLHYGPVFYADTFIHVVRKPKKTKTYRQFGKVFALSTFLFVLLVYIAEICFFILLFKVNDGKSVDYSKIFIKVICMTLNSAVHGKILPAAHFRITFLFYAFYGLILDTIFLGKLSSVFRMPIYEISINDKLDMYLNNFTFYISMYSERQLMVVYEAFDNHKLENMILFTNRSSYDILYDIAANQKNGATVFFSVYSMYEIEKICVNVMSAEYYFISTLFSSYALQKINIKNEVVNYWAREILEKGFFEKHTKDISIYHRHIHLLHNIPQNERTSKTLSIAHYEELFLIIGYGYSLALIIFIFELFIKSLMQTVNETKNIAPF